MIKVYLLITTIFLEILFIRFELDELQNWYKAVEDQMFEDFSTREKKRKYARKKAAKNIFKILIVGLLVLFGISFLK